MFTVYFALYAGFALVIMFAAGIIWDLVTPDYYVEPKKDLKQKLQNEKNMREVALQNARNAQLIREMRACQE